MRLFLGVDLPDHLKTAADAAVSELRTALSSARAHIDARWVASANLHITLVFIGEVPDERAHAMIDALRPPVRTGVFELELADFGVFPPSGAVRVIWIGTRRGAESLAALHVELTGRMLPLGVRTERREYSAHLTVARIKDEHRGNRHRVRQLIAERRIDVGRCRVEAVTLFRSRLSPKGSQYEPLLRIPLS
jgi:2'-5' RNA ligase